jgi:hypothetical protein
MKAKRGLARLLASMALALGAHAAAAQVSTVAPAAGVMFAVTGAAAQDRLIFHNGRVVEGEIVEETDTQVRMRVNVSGMKAEMTYSKDQLLKVEYGEKSDGDEAAPAAPANRAGVRASDRAAAEPRDPSSRTRVYVLNLEGVFARDITQTPIADAVREAERLEADYIIVKVNNDWTNPENRFEDLKDDVIGAFDGFFRTKEIAPLLREDLRKWKKPPKLAMWVHTAMGGAAFMPLLSDTIYFHPDGKMGGVGGIFEMFGGRGDPGVVEKQISLRLVTAQGFAIENGYDAKLIEAMTRLDYVLSYRMVGGKPQYFERMPENPGENLLTDDGTDDDMKDAMEDRVRGLGNDFLTLTAEMAHRLGVSKGTVNTMDDLLFELGIARTAQIVGKSDRIMKGWADGLDRAELEMRSLWEDQQRVQVAGDWDERRRGRGRKINLLEQMRRLIRKYSEALPGGYPTEPQIATMIEQLKLEQLRDKK